jgi:ATP-dependent helicase/nuclease subunit A
LHSFAAHLLRLYPIESGVDPDFIEDDGLRFEEHFQACWELWLDRELGPNGRDHGCWRRILAAVDLVQLRELAQALCNELVSLDEVVRQIEARPVSPFLREWLAHKRGRAETLLAAHDRPKRRKAEKLLAAAQDLFGLLLERGLEGLSLLDAAHRDNLGGDLGAGPSGWSEEDFAEARSLIETTQRLLPVDQALIQDLVSLVLPLVREVRQTFQEKGWISFDGLLAKARDLLRDHPSVRARLKGDYEAVLVDEFQDTDPVQYEIILYLAERAGHISPTWREVELAQGKLFIVGDPKQSIYAFRRADIEAFQVVIEMIRASGGISYELATNFRSHAAVLEVVNEVFDRLLRPQESLQPPNVRLVPRPDRQGGLAKSGVELRVVAAGEGDEGFDAAAATRAEAEALAQWLKEELIERESLTDTQGRQAPLKPGHVALLFRTLTQAQEYLDALRRHQIAYVTDGEKHFYRRQEVIDLVNLLRVVDNPHDSVALVGLLRSPLGGLTDRDIYELSERGALNCRRVDCLAGWKSPQAPSVQCFYECLAELHRTAAGRPLPEAIDLLFDRLPILELAAASLHGEQAVANLIKVREIAAGLADRPHLTLTNFVDLMGARLTEQPEEAESALAEESLEAVRVLTIHKAKGLEFPVVILPGLHQGTGQGHQFPLLSKDWSSGVVGLSLEGQWSLGGVVVNEKLRARQEAERRRVFYVGMTRARERLVLSGGITASPSRGSFLALLREAADREIGGVEESALPVGPASFSQTVLVGGERRRRSRQPALSQLRPASGWSEQVQRWEQRDRVWAVVRATPRQMTPTRLAAKTKPESKSTGGGADGQEQARLVGTLAHRILEGWDFAVGREQISQLVTQVCRQGIPQEWKGNPSLVEAELLDLLATFTASQAYAELGRATILGREIPFAIPWESFSVQHSAFSAPPCIMEGVIDLVYRLDGQVWIADYKTDRVEEGELAGRTLDYRAQADVYRTAVSRCLGVGRVGFKFIFLRSGSAVEV